MYARITDGTGGTTFGNEVQPKPTSPGYDYGRSSPNRNTVRSGSQQYATFPCEPVLCRHGYNSGPPLIFMRSPGYKSPTRTLHPTANTTPNPNVTN
jgi:hypothetical protein